MSDHPLMSFEDTKIAFEAKSDQALRKTHFVFSSMKKPWMVKSGTILTNFALKMRLPVKGIIKSTLFEQFCGGESIRDCGNAIQHLGKYNVQTILDYSVEGQEKESSFDHTRDEALRVADYAQSNPNIPFVVVKLTGLGSRTLMAKKAEGGVLTQEENERFHKFKQRVKDIAQRVYEHGLKFMIDAEESWILPVTDRVALELMLEFNQDRPVIYTTYQFYRHQALPDMKKHFQEIRTAGKHFGAKLVRGAYMETERERAREKGYPDPIQPDKLSTDRDYDEAQQFIIENLDHFSVCSGTHNENSNAFMANLMDAHGIDRSDERVYFAQLMGMSDNISFKLAKEGYNVAKYVPYGPVELVLPYLFRRAEENTSIAGQSGREYTLVKKELKRRKANR
jgi:proline dehydrogenase